LQFVFSAVVAVLAVAAAAAAAAARKLGVPGFDSVDL
jgi:hypothetical protein